MRCISTIPRFAAFVLALVPALASATVVNYVGLGFSGSSGGFCITPVSNGCAREAATGTVTITTAPGWPTESYPYPYGNATVSWSLNFLVGGLFASGPVPFQIGSGSESVAFYPAGYTVSTFETGNHLNQDGTTTTYSLSISLQDINLPSLINPETIPPTTGQNQGSFSIVEGTRISEPNGTPVGGTLLWNVSLPVDYISTTTPAPDAAGQVPEPGSLALMVAALAALFALRPWRHRDNP